jgi:hypothetical protein
MKKEMRCAGKVLNPVVSSGEEGYNMSNRRREKTGKEESI